MGAAEGGIRGGSNFKGEIMGFDRAGGLGGLTGVALGGLTGVLWGGEGKDLGETLNGAKQCVVIEWLSSGGRGSHVEITGGDGFGEK